MRSRSISYQFLPEGIRTSASTKPPLLTVSDAADRLGVHANTVRAWTDQGMLACLRINRRGDRRYRPQDIDRFLAEATAAKRETRRRSAPRDSGSPRCAAVIEAVARVATSAPDLDTLMIEAGRVLCLAGGYGAAAVVTSLNTFTPVIGDPGRDPQLVAEAVDSRQPALGRVPRPDGAYRAALPIVVEGSTWQVLLVSGTKETRTADERSLLFAVRAQLGIAAQLLRKLNEEADGRRGAELIVGMTSDIGSELDLPRLLEQLVDRAMELFSADRAGIINREPDGSFRTRATRNLSPEYRQAIEHAVRLPLVRLAVDERRVITAPDFPDDPRSIELRHAIIRAGINTVTVAPLLADGQALGVLALYHNSRFEFSAAQMALLQQLANAAATMLRNAQNFSQMATWAAQLQSIQQLGARLTRLRTVSEIGSAICAELNQLIDYHNVRVYRIVGDDCVPVAWRGEIGEYEDEDIDQLRVKVGEGITGWVARHGLAQNLPDASKDKRAQTIPGTEDDMEESLLLAPMLYEDDVIGVIVLAKLGAGQFTGDDLRLLEIYASIAAQAMANADATERLRAQSDALERQLNSQRELLRVTESILSTLDTQHLLEEIADSLGTLLQYDNISVDVHDQEAHLLRPIFARGVHAAEYLLDVMRDDEGEGGYVIRTGEPLLIHDELTDPRVAHFESTGPLAGSLIVAPLRSGDRVPGLLTVERLGADARFTDEEFELVKLFAAHVAIALQNAEAHRAVELRAETDRLTGVWNHGSLIEHIDNLVATGKRFGMLMVDLDFFKRYNDRYGHQAGNVMLQRIAGMLKASCRDTDRVFRFGGDEFALLLPETGLAGARTVGEKILAAVNAISADDPGAAINCSIGVAVFPKDGPDGASIILAADRACYAAKRAGRARIATANDGLALAADFEPTQPALPEPRAAQPSLSAA